jgi:hypothetical protein
MPIKSLNRSRTCALAKSSPLQLVSVSVSIGFSTFLLFLLIVVASQVDNCHNHWQVGNTQNKQTQDKVYNLEMQFEDQKLIVYNNRSHKRIRRESCLNDVNGINLNLIAFLVFFFFKQPLVDQTGI